MPASDRDKITAHPRPWVKYPPTGMPIVRKVLVQSQAITRASHLVWSIPLMEPASKERNHQS